VVGKLCHAPSTKASPEARRNQWVTSPRRVTTGYDKLAEKFLGFIRLTAVRLWLRHFVNATLAAGRF
jgi:hypothetical protein